MKSNDISKMIDDNPEIAKTLEEALRRNASAAELAEILSGAGIDEGITDDLLAECQRRRGDDIGFEDLDPEALEMIAGGEGIDKGSCVNDYYKEACSSTVESGSWCSVSDWCMLFSSNYSAKEDYDKNACRISYHSAF